MRHTLFLFLLSACLPMTLQATIQIPERIYINGQSAPVQLHATPLERLDSLRYAEFQRRLDSCNTAASQITLCTGLYRGYQATWSLRNDSLQLLEVMNTESALNPDSQYACRIPMDGIVQSDGFADWFTGELRISKGDILHTDYLLAYTQYSIEWIYTFDKGIVTSCRKYNNGFIGADPKVCKQAFKQTCKEKLLPKKLRSKYYEKIRGWISGRADEAGRVHDLEIQLEFYRDTKTNRLKPDTVYNEKSPELHRLRRCIEKLPWYSLRYNGEIQESYFFWRPMQ